MYQIRLYNERKKNIKYIILTQMSNLIDNNFYIDPMVLQSTYKYTWGIYQNYFIQDLHKPALPTNYYVELLDKDYVIYKGLPDYSRSYFLKELVVNNIISIEYRDAILIGLDGDWNLEIPENRMYEHLCQKLLIPLMNTYHIDKNRIMILDNILNNDWENKLYQSKLNYNINKHKYFDPVILDLYIGKYNKKRY